MKIVKSDIEIARAAKMKPIAEVLAKEIRKQILGHSCVRNRLKLLPPVRSNTPPPEITEPLAKKYFAFI